jgi:poly(3-hydroxybutyrate) depolymerase
VDGDTREYYVHVPTNYTGDAPVPVVMMLHGGSGTGEITYRQSGWKEVGEKENFISVFPTAWSYCWIKKSGVVKDTTRWNSFPGLFDFCPGEVPRNDINFLGQMIDELTNRFNVDERRLYMVGFSSGAQMTFRSAVELRYHLAATVESGGTHQLDTVFTPDHKPAMMMEMGNHDATWFENGLYPPLAYFDTLLMTAPLLQRVVNAHTRSFDFDTTYQLSGNPDSIMVASFSPIPPTDHREFVFTLVNGLDHSYPNGNNHPFYGARFHWNWMKQFIVE